MGSHYPIIFSHDKHTISAASCSFWRVIDNYFSINNINIWPASTLLIITHQLLNPKRTYMAYQRRHGNVPLHWLVLRPKSDVSMTNLADSPQLMRQSHAVEYFHVHITWKWVCQDVQPDRLILGFQVGGGTILAQLTDASNNLWILWVLHLLFHAQETATDITGLQSGQTCLRWREAKGDLLRD